MGTVRAERRRVELTGQTDIEIIEFAGGERTVLFLGGAYRFDSAAIEMLQALADRGYRVLAPNHPGFGHSDLPDTYSAVTDIALLYGELLEQLHETDVTVVGESFGGWIALEMGLFAPERLRSLVLMSPVGVKLVDVTTLEFRDIYATSPAETMKWLYGAAAVTEVASVAELDQHDAEGYARSRQALARFGWRPYLHNPLLSRWLHRIKVPIHVVSGDCDGIARSGYFEDFALAAQAVDHTVVPGGPHFLHAVSPVSVAAILAAKIANTVEH